METGAMNCIVAFIRPFQLDAVGQRPAGQLVEDAGRLVRLDRRLDAVAAEADLDARRRGQLGRAADAHDHTRSEHGHAVGQLLCLVEVVRREEHRLAECAE